MPLVIEGNFDKDFLSSVVKFFCNALGIDVPENLHIFTDETIKVCGACYQNDDNDYMIVLRERDNTADMIVTLAHELTHVKQYIRDDLKTAFTTAIPYMERWWEIEAYAKESELVELLISAVERKEI
jgi:hypothetical protein